MKTFWVGLLRGCRHGSHILERGHFCAPAERPPAVLGETWFLLGSKQGSDSISLDSQNSFFDHKVIVSLAMNKQLFRKVGHLLQPKMSPPPGTGGLKVLCYWYLFSTRQTENPRWVFYLQNHSMHKHHGLLLIFSVSTALFNTIFYNLEQVLNCSRLQQGLAEVNRRPWTGTPFEDRIWAHFVSR